MQNAHVIAFHKAQADTFAAQTKMLKSIVSNAGVAVVGYNMAVSRMAAMHDRDYHNARALLESRKAKAFAPIIIK